MPMFAQPCHHSVVIFNSMTRAEKALKYFQYIFYLFKKAQHTALT